ncbi:MAG TPA: DUF488 family protein [Terriglobales bacterium]|nr:DUF488 family protein [Terriglobales bacterium]
MAVLLKRVYEAASSRDGFRVLVDRLWPRGMTKEAAKVDLWLKDIAPSDELRKWYHSRPTQWPKFRERYLEELSEPAALAAVEQLHAIAAKKKAITLLFGSKNLERNNAVVLKELLDGMKKPPHSTGGAAAAKVARQVRAR